MTGNQGVVVVYCDACTKAKSPHRTRLFTFRNARPGFVVIEDTTGVQHEYNRDPTPIGWELTGRPKPPREHPLPLVWSLTFTGFCIEHGHRIVAGSDVVKGLRRPTRHVVTATAKP